MNSRRKDITGQRFAKLVVESYAGLSKRGEAVWNCICDCGKRKANVSGTYLRTGRVKSCGCQRTRAVPTPWRVGTSFHTAFRNAKNRCVNPRCPDFPRYGGRGIEFRFLTAKQMFEEIGARPSPKHTLDRLDNNQHYQPGNVCWSTRTEQAQNRRKRCDSNSNYKGVHRRGTVYDARIKANGETMHLGTFKTEIAAALAYDAAALMLFTRPCFNFPSAVS